MMPKSARRLSSWHYPFWLVIAIALGVYILRGFGILAFLPGGVVLGLGAIAIVLGIGYGIDRSRRF